MPLEKIKLKPGINRNTTDYDNEGGYFAGDKVRFRAGAPEKIGGWVKYTNATVAGTPRMLFNWVTLDSTNILAIGTNIKFYVEAGALYDVTPLRTTKSLGSNPLSVTSGSAVVTVTNTAHGASTGDFVTLAGAATTGGILAADLNKEFQLTVIDADHYTVTAATSATSTANGGGASITAAYQLTTASDIAVPGYGWNAGGWGRGTWGSPATTETYSTLRLWSAEAFGQDLVFCPRNGPLYVWYYNLGLNHRATPLKDVVGANEVPLMATKVLLATQSRHLIAFGTNPIGDTDQDPLLIRWCAAENMLEWEPDIADSSGDLRVPTGNYIVTAIRLQQEILVFTDASITAMQYIGAPDIFGLQPVADNISIISANAVAVAGNAAFWMGNDKFYLYNGRTQTLPCSLENYVFSDINLTQADQIHAGTNEEFSEIWWFYCSAGSNSIDRYVIYNYDENLWAYGTMHRTVWLDTSLKQHPVAATEQGVLYYHEDGVDDDRINPINAWIESSDFDLGDGDSYMFVKRVLPDISFVGSASAQPAVTMTFTPRNAPGAVYKSGDAGAVRRSAALPVEAFTERLDVRLRGRQMKMRIESNGLGVHWKLGAMRMEMQPDGRKS